MAPHTKRGPLARGEYLNSVDTPGTVDGQTAGARRELIRVIQRAVPEFFERLRAQVYPKFARYARGGPHSRDHRPRTASRTRSLEVGMALRDLGNSVGPQPVYAVAVVMGARFPLC